jgi:tellurite resistance protein TerC
VLPTTEEYHSDRLTTKIKGKRFITPLFIALIAIGSADILFAVDSIPAIFGLTEETYLVFTANAFALLGLRQLFFLLDGLLDRLVYLAYGLAVILGFIGVKLVIHALHENELPFINGGEHVTAIPEIPTWLSLAVIVVTLLVTTWASLRKNRKDARAGRTGPTDAGDAGADRDGRQVAAPQLHDDLPTDGRADAPPTGRTAAVTSADTDVDAPAADRDGR